MNIRSRLSILCFAVALAGCGGGSTGTGLCCSAGVVTDPNSEGIGDATVQVDGDPNASITGANGSFSLDTIDWSVSQTIFVTHDGRTETFSIAPRVGEREPSLHLVIER